MNRERCRSVSTNRIRNPNRRPRAAADAISARPNPTRGKWVLRAIASASVLAQKLTSPYGVSFAIATASASSEKRKRGATWGDHDHGTF